MYVCLYVCLYVEHNSDRFEYAVWMYEKLQNAQLSFGTT